MEIGTIERELHVEASPDIVFDVVSSHDHIHEWWGGVDTDMSPVPGSTGQLRFGPEGTASFTIIEAIPPRLFSFRWCYNTGDVATTTNSLLVTFELTPNGSGTTLRMTESGWREIGWEAAVLEAAYADHNTGWDLHFMGGLNDYLKRLVASA